MIKDFRNISACINAMKNIEVFEESYVDTQNRLMEEIEAELRKNLECDMKILNDIKDYGAIVEEKAFMIGVYEGIRLARLVNMI